MGRKKRPDRCPHKGLRRRKVVVRCPVCQHECSEDARACSRCGTDLRATFSDAAAPRGTLFGLAPPTAATGDPGVARRDLASPPDDMARTLLGLAPPVSPEDADSGRTLLNLKPPRGDEAGQTLLGLAPPQGAESVQTPVGSPPPALTGEETLRDLGPTPGRPEARTLMGLAPPPPEPPPAPAPAPTRRASPTDEAPTIRRTPRDAPAPAPTPAPAPRGQTVAAAPRAKGAPAPAKQAPARADAPVVAQEAASTPAPRRPGMDTIVLHQQANEIIAAARLAGAVASEERGAFERRLRFGLWVLLGIALLALTVGVLTHRARHRFTAEAAGDLHVQRDAEGYAVRVRLRSSAPARLVLPDGAQGGPTGPLEGETEVAFRLPAVALPVGDNRIALSLVPVDDPESGRPLSLQVRVFYRFVSNPAEPPRAGTTWDVVLQVMPGWSLAVEGGRVEPAAPGQVRVALEPERLLRVVDRFPGPEGELPLRLTLTGPAGEKVQFTETLRFPLPVTALTLLTPLRHAVLGEPVAWVEGLATPGASIRAEGAEALADAAGRFRLAVPVATTGRVQLAVTADMVQRAPRTQELVVERVAPAELTARRTAARRLVDAVTARPPPYDSLRAPPGITGPIVRIQGKVLAMRRGSEPELDEIQLATCAAGCPWWVLSRQPAFVALGQEAVAVGRLAGQVAIPTRDGQVVANPRLEAMAVVSLRNP